MRVVVPFQRLHPVTKKVVDYYRPEYVHLEDDDGYRLLMQRLWREREPVIIIEQDIVPWPYAVEELWRCSCSWGSYSYQLHGGIGIVHGFGCCKLTTILMDAVPNVWDEPERWDVLDQRLFFAAREVGLEPHRHRPDVTHLNERHYNAPERH